MPREMYGSPLEALEQAVRAAEGVEVDALTSTLMLMLYGALRDFAKDCLLYEGNRPSPDLCRRMLQQAVRLSTKTFCGPVVELALEVLGSGGAVAETVSESGETWFYQLVQVGPEEVQHRLYTHDWLVLAE